MLRRLSSHSCHTAASGGLHIRKARGFASFRRNVSVPTPSSSSGTHRAAGGSPKAESKQDLTGQLVQSIFKLALQRRLESHDTIDVHATCNARSLLEGLFNGIYIKGTNWVTPLQLTAELLQVEFGAMQLDLNALVWQRRVTLLNVPRGHVRIVLSAEDLSNFMVHPLMATAASRAVQVPSVHVLQLLPGVETTVSLQEQPFLFKQDSVIITQQQVLFSGAWQGRTYDVVMSPITGSGYGRDQSALQVTARLAGGRNVDEGASTVALGLAQFFGSLELDLQGIEISSPSLTLATSSRDAVEQHLLEIQMNVRLRALPPLNMEF